MHEVNIFLTETNSEYSAACGICLYMVAGRHLAIYGIRLFMAFGYLGDVPHCHPYFGNLLRSVCCKIKRIITLLTNYMYFSYKKLFT